MTHCGDDYWKSFLPSTGATEEDEEKFIVDGEPEQKPVLEPAAAGSDEEYEDEELGDEDDEIDPEDEDDYQPPVKKRKYKKYKQREEGKEEVIPNTIIRSTRGGFLAYDDQCFEYRLSNAKRDRTQIDTNRIIPLRCNVRTCNAKARLHQGVIVDKSTSEHTHPPRMKRNKVEPICIDITAILPRGPQVKFDFAAKGGVVIEVEEYKYRLTYSKRDEDQLDTESILPVRCAVRACSATARIQHGYLLKDGTQTEHIHPPDSERKRVRRIVLSSAQEKLGLPNGDGSIRSVANLVNTLNDKNTLLDVLNGSMKDEIDSDAGGTDGSDSPARDVSTPALDTTADTTLNSSNVYSGPPTIGNLVKSIRGSFLVYDDKDFEYRLANSKRDQPLILTDTVIPLRCNVKSCISKAKMKHGLVVPDTPTPHSHEPEPGMKERRVTNYSKFEKEQMKSVAKLVLRNYMDSMEYKEDLDETKPANDSYSHMLPSTSSEDITPTSTSATATITIETRDLILPQSMTPESGAEGETGEIEDMGTIAKMLALQDDLESKIETTVTKSNRGGYLFYDDEGYEYRLSNAKRDQTQVDACSDAIIPVRCNQRSCHSNGRVQSNKLIGGSITPHNHEPEWGKKEKRLTIHAIREDRKKGVSIRTSVENLGADARLLLPSIPSLSRQIQRRIKVESDVTMEWPYRGWQKLIPGLQTFENFADSYVPEDQHMFIVAHPMGLTRLFTHDEWFIDTHSFENYKPFGMDKMCCIGTMVNGNVVPGAWFGYVGESAPEKYKCVFMWLKSKLTGSPPRVIVCDFDADISQAVVQEFPSIRIVRCNLAQHVLVEIEAHGLSTEVETNAHFVNLLRSLVSLQYVSPSSAKTLFSALLLEVRKKAAVLLPLFNDFAKTYIGRRINKEWQEPTFAPMEWCVEDRYLHGLPVEFNASFILEVMKESLPVNGALHELSEWIADREKVWSSNAAKNKVRNDDREKLVKTLKSGYDVGEELSFLLQLSDFVNFQAVDDITDEDLESFSP